MKELIEAYIKDHTNAWSPTTLRSERYRLFGILSILQEKWDPEYVYMQLKGKYGAYSLTSLFIRLSHFNGWLIDNGHRSGVNQFRAWKKKNALLFKGAYQREKIEITFEEARKRITSLPNNNVKDLALFILHNGLRISETESIVDGKIHGKGKKTRTLLGRDACIRGVSQSRLRDTLRPLGLKPHTLRKLFATRLSQAGAKPEDLCQALGWSSFNTAMWYLQPKKEDELRDMVKQAVGI